MTRKPKKYDHSRYFWHDIDLFHETCRKKIVKCPSGYKGHFTRHLNQNVNYVDEITKDLMLQVIRYIAHSHFTHETDRSRHTICEVNRTYIAAKYCKVKYSLDDRILPDWVRDDLYGEYGE